MTSVACSDIELGCDSLVVPVWVAVCPASQFSDESKKIHWLSVGLLSLTLRMVFFLLQSSFGEIGSSHLTFSILLNIKIKVILGDKTLEYVLFKTINTGSTLCVFYLFPSNIVKGWTSRTPLYDLNVTISYHF